MPYELLKTLHVIGAACFVGNIVVTALWKSLADCTRDPVVIGFGQRLVTITDIVFTASSVVLLAITGPIMVARYGGIGGAAWLQWGVGLFALSGMLWVAVLIPVQVMQARLARKFQAGGEIPQQYWKLARVWMLFGSMAVVLPLMTVYFMVAKPV